MKVTPTRPSSGTVKLTGVTQNAGDFVSIRLRSPGIIALRAPFATIIWDYINRGMPLYREGTLKPEEVYSLVAFLLYKNGVIQENEVMGPESLPNVKMPNRDGFAFPPDWKRGTPRLQNYP